jgi:hypothetical protein
MRPHMTACFGALAVLAAAGCGSGRTRENAGAAPIDTVHIRSGDTLPPANPAVRRAPHDTSTADTARQTGDTTTPGDTSSAR